MVLQVLLYVQLEFMVSKMMSYKIVLQELVQLLLLILQEFTMFLTGKEKYLNMKVLLGVNQNIKMQLEILLLVQLANYGKYRELLQTCIHMMEVLGCNIVPKVIESVLVTTLTGLLSNKTQIKSFNTKQQLNQLQEVKPAMILELEQRELYLKLIMTSLMLGLVVR